MRARIPEFGMLIFRRFQSQDLTEAQPVYMLTPESFWKDDYFCRLVSGPGWSGICSLKHLKRDSTWVLPEEWL